MSIRKLSARCAACNQETIKNRACRWCSKIAFAGGVPDQTSKQCTKLAKSLTLKKMDTLSIGIMRLSEMRLTGSGQDVVNNHQIYLGNLNGVHMNGVPDVLQTLAQYQRDCYSFSSILPQLSPTIYRYLPLQLTKRMRYSKRFTMNW